MKLYHNPRCSKSRATKQILDDHGIEAEVIEYLKEAPTASDLDTLPILDNGSDSALPEFPAVVANRALFEDARCRATGNHSQQRTMLQRTRPVIKR